MENNDSDLLVRDFNGHFLLIRSKSGKPLQSLGKAIYQKNFHFIDECIATEAEICLKTNGFFKEGHLNEVFALAEEKQAAPKSFVLPVFFDKGGDWPAIESYGGINREGVVKAIAESVFSLSMFGFLPGFLYLDGLPEQLQIPRKSVPSKYIKAGSVAIGGRYLGVYALDSPGGWNVIGKCPLVLLDREGVPPVSIQPGDKIRIKPIQKNEFDRLRETKTNLLAYNAAL